MSGSNVDVAIAAGGNQTEIIFLVVNVLIVELYIIYYYVIEEITKFSRMLSRPSSQLNVFYGVTTD